MSANSNMFSAFVSRLQKNRRSKMTAKFLNELPEHIRKDIGWPAVRGL